eukprot:symbB.v1.2.012705.t1/scaffold812.1/size160323/13
MVVSYQFFLAAAKRCLSADQWQASRVQRSQMKEMQLDASAIAIGFLLCQSICYYLSEAEDIHHRFIPILHGYPSEQKEHSVTVLCILAAVLLVLSAIWSIYLRPRKGCLVLTKNRHSCASERNSVDAAPTSFSTTLVSCCPALAAGASNAQGCSFCSVILLVPRTVWAQAWLPIVPIL